MNTPTPPPPPTPTLSLPLTLSLTLSLTLTLTLTLALGCQSSSKERARAMRISTQSQLIGGPKALGEIGDYLLENDKIRVIIHGPGTNRASTLFPGSIIDADLQRPGGSDNRGNDQVGEISPAFLFEAFNPTRFDVTADGSDGGAAILTVEGTGGDLLEQVALLNTGILFPPALRFRIDYVLEPGAQYLEVITTLINDSGNVHPLPFLDPPDLADLGLDIPGLDTLELSVPLGHFALFGGENKLFATGPTGFNVRFSIEDSYLEAGGLPAFPGRVTDYLATRGHGVSYAIAVPPTADNYPNTFADLYPGQRVTDHSVLMPFQFSAVVALYSANPPSVLAPGQEFSYTINLVVGRGDVGSVTDIIFEDIHEVATGSFAGRLFDRLTKAPVAGASVVVQDLGGNFISQFDTDEDGGFRGELPAGNYSYRILSEARFPSASKSFQVDVNRLTSVLDEIEPVATLAVQVRDGDGRPIPCKISLVGRFADSDRGRDPREFLYDLALGESIRPTSFDPTRNDFLETAWYTRDGRSLRHVRPGVYDLVVSRGPEYDLHRESIEMEAGGFIDRTVTLRRTVDTDGWVGADTHLHSAGSVDSGLSLEDRVISIAGEGIEYAAATDHNAITDYAPEIGRQDLTEWLVSSIGLEITTFEMGHFNAFPLAHDSSTTRGGKFEWVGRTPTQLFDGLRALSAGAPEDVVVQVNHPRWDFLGYFNVFNLDQDIGLATSRSGLRGVLAPAGPEFELEQFSLDFDAVEILNGKRLDLLHTYRSPAIPPPPPVPDPLPAPGEVVRDNAGQPAFPGAVEDWFVLLNRGLRFTGVGASDSHETVGHEPGFPRTFVFVGEGKDGIGQFTAADVVAGLKAGRASLSMGPFVDLRINGELIGSEIVDTDGSIDVEIIVRAPNWSPIETVILWSNGDKVLEIDVPDADATDFTTTRVLTLDADAWFLVEVLGSINLFPVVPPKEYETLSPATIISALSAGFDLSSLDPFGNLRPSQTFAVTPVALTNPIWIDRDGNGEFDAPRTSGLGSSSVARVAAESSAPAGDDNDLDVRRIFDAFDDSFAGAPR